MSKTQKKKFKETKLGEWLKDKAPNLLHQVADFLPDAGSLGILKRGIEILSPEDKKQGLKEIEKVERKLTQIDIENAKIDLEELKAKLDDRESARNREVETLKINKRSPLMQIIGFGLLFCYVGLLLALIFLNIPEQNKDQLIHMEGIMEGGILAMVSYYFGDSQKNQSA